MDKISKQIIEELIRYQSVTIRSLSDKFNKTQRTIYNYIAHINNELLDFGAQIISDYNGNYSILIVNEKKFENLKKDINSSFDYNDQQTRIHYLLNLFLFSNCYYKMDDLCDKLHVSRSLMKQDIKEVREILERNHLILKNKPYYGMIVEGTEMNKRLCYRHHVADFHEKSSIQDETKNTIRNTIVSVLINCDYRISDESLDNLIMHIYIALQRIKQKTYVHIDDNILQEQKKTKEYEIASTIVSLLSKLFGIDIDENECGYITLHLRSKKIAMNSEHENISNEEASILKDKIIRKISEISNYDFYKDLNFVIALYQHLIPLLIRIQYGMSLENPLLNEIKSKMRRAYDLAIAASLIINEEKQVLLSEDEIGYIAMHIEASLNKERSLQKKKILIVCSSGKGTANLMKINFQNIFKEYLSEIVVCSYLELEKYLDDSIDCIFTTIDLNTKAKVPIIKVNSMVDEREAMKGKDIFTGFRLKSILLKYLKPDLLIQCESFDNKEQAVNYLIEKCSHYYNIPNHFADKVYEREKVSSTEFDNLIALPHPIYPMSEETFIAMIILKKPLTWYKQKIRLILLLSCSKKAEEDIDDLYKAISKITQNKQHLLDFLNSPNYNRLLSLIKE